MNEERAAKENYLKQLDVLNAQFESYGKEDIERARAMIPNEEDVPGILAMLEAAAQASDVQLTAVNFAAGDTGGQPSRHAGTDHGWGGRSNIEGGKQKTLIEEVILPPAACLPSETSLPTLLSARRSTAVGTRRPSPGRSRR